MADCNGKCSACGQTCDRRIEKAKLNDLSKVKKIIGVISGKGGVGKSLVSSLIASGLSKSGDRVAILDADITGPSIPKSFGIKEKAMGEEGIIYPALSKTGIQIMSANLLLENEDDPIIWRGPMIGDLVKQFYTDVLWHNVDYMVIDMPPGTGDVALTTFQYLPVDGIIIVTSPQDLVSTIVKKAIKMASEMNIPILGLVENMSYVECPTCKEKIYVYGKSHIDEVAKQFNLEVLGKLPLREDISRLVDEGEVEDIDVDYLNDAIKKIKSL
ncbi:MAG: Mrp/NBP35 family ATP-binding protein [Erysipelotrichales bacterium]|nr:Mrp/NBP35 family ATP-binding protein [Erysipelotrichales bacterium]